jgi:replicative DNA helicase
MSAQLPQNVEAEDAVVGAVLIDPACLADVLLTLEPSDFYTGRNRLVYEAYLALYEQGKPIDVLTVTTQLEQVDKL